MVIQMVQWKPPGSETIQEAQGCYKLPLKTRCNSVEVPAYGQYYVYSSGPKAAPMDRPKYKSGTKPKGISDYHNIMWDPRVYRGASYKTFKKSEDERCIKKSNEDNKKKTKKVVKQMFGGVERPSTPNFTGKSGLENMGIQTDLYLVELYDEVFKKSMCTQTESISDISIPIKYCPIKLGTDAVTQIMPWELFHFDDEVRPVVTSIVGKIVEQSLLECMEEEELSSLLAQQRVYEEKRRLQLMRLDRLQKREQMVTEEKERLIEQRRIQVQQERDTEARVISALFAATYLKGCSANAMGDLRVEGFISHSDGLDKLFIPWLHGQAMVKTWKHVNAASLLDSIIQDVSEKRQGDYMETYMNYLENWNKGHIARPESPQATFNSAKPLYTPAGYDAELEDSVTM